MYPFYSYPQSSPQPCRRGQIPQFVDSTVQSDVSKPHHPASVPWPYSNNGFSCASPPQNITYCSHHFPPGCYPLWPQPHGQPFPIHYNGPYPNSYTPCYFPTPCYNPPGSYCCSFLNHPCHQNEYNNPNREKVEEQKPGTSNYSSVHPVIRLPNCPYPVALVHPSYLPDQRKETSDGRVPSVDKGCLDVKVLPQLDEPNNEGNISDDVSKTNWRLPLVWVPGYDKPMEEGKVMKEANENQKRDNFPGNIKIVPLKLIDGENSNDKPPTSVPPTSEKNSKSARLPTLPDKDANSKSFKFIPVKPIEEGDQCDKPTASVKDSTTVTPTSIKTVPVKQLDVNGGKQDINLDTSKSSSKRRENSEESANTGRQANAGKQARLPPICLRVDPLPKKKTKKDSSRSPSPIQKEKHPAGSGSKASGPQDEGKNSKEIKVVEAKDIETEKSHGPIIYGNTNAEELAVNSNAIDENNEKLGPSSVFNGCSNIEKLKEIYCGGHLLQKEKVDDNVKVDPSTSELPKSFELRNEKFKLSATDAATIVQSAFRGYQVRKGEPLKKLKQIARVREQINALKGQIDALEACSMNTKESKERVVIGEAIMNLLFSLDNIQGLCPSARDVRRDVVRELVRLQEKLDSFSDKETKNHGCVEGIPNGINEAHNSADGCHDDHGLFTDSRGGPKEETANEFTHNNGEEIKLMPSASSSLEQGDSDKVLMGEIALPKLRPVKQEEFCGASDRSGNTAMEASIKPAMLWNESNSESTSPIIALRSQALEMPRASEEAFISDINPIIHSQAQSSQSTSEVKPDIDCHIQSLKFPQLENLSAVESFIQTEILRSKMENLEKDGSEAVSDSKICGSEKQSILKELVDPPSTHVAIADHSSVECPFMVDNVLAGDGCAWNKDAINMERGEGHVEHLELHGTSEAKSLGQADLQTSLSTELAIQVNDTKAQGVPNSENVKNPSSGGQATPMQSEQETICEEGKSSLQRETSLIEGNNDDEAPCHPSYSYESAEPVEHSIDKDRCLKEESEPPAVPEPKVSSNNTDTDMDSRVLFESVKSLDSPQDGLEHRNVEKEVRDEGINVHEDDSDSESSHQPMSQLTDSKQDCLDDVFASKSEQDASETGKILDKQENKLMQENKELRAMLEQLLETGKRQMEAMSDLNWRVKDLEKKLSHKRRSRLRRCNGAAGTNGKGVKLVM